MDEDRFYVCRYCGKQLPSRYSMLPCPGSPDDQHRPPAKLDDSTALDRLTDYLNERETWNGGGVCEYLAEVLTATGREVES